MFGYSKIFRISGLPTTGVGSASTEYLVRVGSGAFHPIEQRSGRLVLRASGYWVAALRVFSRQNHFMLLGPVKLIIEPVDSATCLSLSTTPAGALWFWTLGSVCTYFMSWNQAGEPASAMEFLPISLSIFLLLALASWVEARRMFSGLERELILAGATVRA